jgi:hypothetical protein
MEALLRGDSGPGAPPPYHPARRNVRPILHRDALTLVTLVTRLHVLAQCRIAPQLAHWRCLPPPPLSAGPGGRPRRYSEESLLLVALLRTSCT